MIGIGIICDWERASRGNAWPTLLAELEPQPQVTLYPIADLIVSPADRLQRVHREQVLVINWDAANGDPEFGAHLCRSWLEHRAPEIIHWVRRGGILLIESQTRLGTPSAGAYAAVLGTGELPVSGLVDSSQPLLGLRRNGVACRKTKRFPSGGSFAGVDDRIEAAAPPAGLVIFPPTMTGLLKNVLDEMRPALTLWRGWFRRSLPSSRTFPWVSILETADTGFGRHSTMQVARVGAGAIFATTMLLATTGQKALVRAIVQTVGNTAILPEPVAPADRAKSWIKVAVAIFGGGIASAMATKGTSLFGSLKPYLAARFSLTPANAEHVIGLLLLPAGIAVFELARRAVLAARKLVRDYIGY